MYIAKITKISSETTAQNDADITTEGAKTPDENETAAEITPKQTRGKKLISK